jgi:hypothetical protein
MRVPSAAELLGTWDSASQASGAQRALLLLQMVCPEPVELLAQMPLGWIAAQLLKLRAMLLGPEIVCLANCQQCGTVVESSMLVEQLTALAGNAELEKARPKLFPLQQGDYCIEFKLPTCADLIALHGNLQSAAQALELSQIQRALHKGKVLEPSHLPADVREALQHAVLDHDPLAHIELSLTCPSCGLRWLETLQVIEFVWTEISALAQRLLGEVARLAYAFGWREADILAMSDTRRRHYLELLPS